MGAGFIGRKHPLLLSLPATGITAGLSMFTKKMMTIAGKKFIANFGTAKAVLHFENNSQLTFTITEKDAAPANITETVQATAKEIRPGLFLVYWQEKSGTRVTQVHDYEKGLLYSNWVTATGGFTHLQGTIAPYTPITVQTTIKDSPAACWKTWTDPAAILRFNNPFDDWHTARVHIDLREGGNFYYRMEARDGHTGFDFDGRYDKIIANQLIEYTGTDGRKTITQFIPAAGGTLVTETFEPDTITPLDLQKTFCQNILENFKNYMETAG